MINNDDITKEIKDKKFQNYLSIRKNLEKLLAKINASKNPRLNYVRANLNIYMKELDKYLLAYLVDLNFKSSKENIVTFIKRKLRNKKK